MTDSSDNRLDDLIRMQKQFFKVVLTTLVFIIISIIILGFIFGSKKRPLVFEMKENNIKSTVKDFADREAKDNLTLTPNEIEIFIEDFLKNIPEFSKHVSVKLDEESKLNDETMLIYRRFKQ